MKAKLILLIITLFFTLNNNFFAKDEITKQQIKNAIITYAKKYCNTDDSKYEYINNPNIYWRVVRNPIGMDVKFYKVGNFTGKNKECLVIINQPNFPNSVYSTFQAWLLNFNGKSWQAVNYLWSKSMDLQKYDYKTIDLDNDGILEIQEFTQSFIEPGIEIRDKIYNIKKNIYKAPLDRAESDSSMYDIIYSSLSGNLGIETKQDSLDWIAQGGKFQVYREYEYDENGEIINNGNTETEPNEEDESNYYSPSMTIFKTKKIDVKIFSENNEYFINEKITEYFDDAFSEPIQNLTKRSKINNKYIIKNKRAVLIN